MTYGEKLAEMRDDLKKVVVQLLAAEEDDAAAQVLNAVTVINHVRDHLADVGLDDSPWLSQGKESAHGK